MAHLRIHPAFKVWMETEEGYVFGPGVYSLLKKIEEEGTLKDAAVSLGMSYRFAWGIIKKAEEKLGSPLIVAHKGGSRGGGGTELTELARQFLVEFSMLRDRMMSLRDEKGEVGYAGLVVRSQKNEIVVKILEADFQLKIGERVWIRKD